MNIKQKNTWLLEEYKLPNNILNESILYEILIDFKEKLIKIIKLCRFTVNNKNW
jgi:hypothetical protein